MSDPSGKKPPEAPGLTININEELQHGVYANRVIIAHSADEFVLDFVCDLPPRAQVVARVVTAPAHARALLDALADNVAQFERKHGPARRGPVRPTDA
jgi:hypothetical protein